MSFYFPYIGAVLVLAVFPHLFETHGNIVRDMNIDTLRDHGVDTSDYEE
jgi:hypothetical protein